MVSHVEFVENSVDHAASKFPDGRPFGPDEHVVQEAIRAALEIIVSTHVPYDFLISPEWDVLGYVIHGPYVTLGDFLCSLLKRYRIIIYIINTWET